MRQAEYDNSYTREGINYDLHRGGNKDQVVKKYVSSIVHIYAWRRKKKLRYIYTRRKNFNNQYYVTSNAYKEQLGVQAKHSALCGMKNLNATCQHKFY